MNNNINLKNDISFWTGFYEGDDPIAWASNRAYLDMNRTMTFRESEDGKSEKEKKEIQSRRNAWRDDVTNIIRAQIEPLTNFDDWHKNVCKEIKQYYTKTKDINGKSILVKREKIRTEKATKLTLGQAQKWLNMMLKYLWLLNRLDLIRDKELSLFVEKYQEFFHIPLDDNIIRYIKRDNRYKRKHDFPCENGLTEAYIIKNFCGYEWSKLSNYKNYISYQKSIRDDLKRNNRYPLEWELTHWHEAVKYYN